MKGIPTLRLKHSRRTVAIAGIGALLVGASLIAGSQAAHAVTTNPITTVYGDGDGGLTLNPGSGSTTAPLTSATTTAGCPSGHNTSAGLYMADPNGSGTFNQVAATLQGATGALTFNNFTVTSTGSLADEFSVFSDLFNGTTQTAAEIFVECSSASIPNPSNSVDVFDTFVTFSADGSSYTTSNTPPAGPPAAVNLTLIASPNPAVSGQSVTLTATASSTSATGTVTFKDNGTTIGGGPVNLTNGVATTPFTAPTVTSADSEPLTATYNPTGTFTAGTGGSTSLTVNPAPLNSGTIPLAVSVPVNGSFQLSVDTTDLVTLTASGLVATGSTTPIGVSDTRNTFPGWSVSGQDSPWTGTGAAAGGNFSGNQLGWKPTDTALAQGVNLGNLVAPASPGAGPGLGTTAATLASVHGGTIGNGFGTTTLGADLTLDIPANAPVGPYTSSLTISAVTSN